MSASINQLPLEGLIHGLLCNGTAPATIVRAPLDIPEDPIPAIARPTMSIFDEVATPHIKEPSSNTVKKPRNTHYTESADHCGLSKGISYLGGEVGVGLPCERLKGGAVKQVRPGM